MTLYEAVIQRHSVRNYKDQPIEEEKLELIEKKIAELNKAGGLHLQLIRDAGKTYNKLMNMASGLGSAPSVIACVGEDGPSLDERVGYYGQQLVLFIQQLGLNTCWAGTFNRKNIGAEVSGSERLVISIALGYGVDQGRLRKSKTPDQVMEGKAERPEWFMKGVECALLAPTAINQQKFAIRLNDDDSVEYIDKGGILSKVDIGIVRCNFEIGAEILKEV